MGTLPSGADYSSHDMPFTSNMWSLLGTVGGNRWNCNPADLPHVSFLCPSLICGSLEFCSGSLRPDSIYMLPGKGYDSNGAQGQLELVGLTD